MASKTKISLGVLLTLVCAAVMPRLGCAQTADIAGKWHFVLQTEGGERTVNPTFQQDGEQVTGKWDDADVKGTFTGGKLNLEFAYTSDEAGPGTLKITGELKDGILTGTWQFQEYSGSFKASRPAKTQ